MIIGLSIITVITALFLEAGILNNVNNKNIHKTSRVLLDQVINIIEKNNGMISCKSELDKGTEFVIKYMK